MEYIHTYIDTYYIYGLKDFTGHDLVKVMLANT
jgi:hypothetical protein